MSRQPGNIKPGNELDYAPRLRWHRTRRFRRLIGWGLVSLWIVSSAWWGPVLWKHADLLYWQRRALQTPPPDAVYSVYDIRRELKPAVPAAWQQFLALLEKREPTLLVAMRTSRGGQSRIVIVHPLLITSDSADSSQTIYLLVETLQPATVLHKSKILSVSGQFIQVGGSPVTIRYPVIDSADTSHFSIELTAPNIPPRIVDGYLTDAGDIVMEQRANP